MMLILALALALAATAPVQEDVYTQSWSSTHWSLVATEGDAPERVAVLVDRDSIRTGATANLREVTLLSTVEGMPLRWGIIARVRVDCTARTFAELGRASFFERGRKDEVPPTVTMAPVKPETGFYPALAGVCDGNWSGFKAVDVVGSEVVRNVFKP